MKKKIGLYWFTNDLRIKDNPALKKAAQSVDVLLCLYCYPPISPFLKHYSQQNSFGAAKKQFLDESLFNLSISLKGLNQELVIVDQNPLEALRLSIENCQISHIFCSQIAGSDERRVLDIIQDQHPEVVIEHVNNHALFEAEQLPFELESLPATFTRFRNKVEKRTIEAPSGDLNSLPPPLQFTPFDSQDIQVRDARTDFKGGEQAGLKHCSDYLTQKHASTYKQTRNGLSGMDYSTKFSPWLAHGCVSVRCLYTMLKAYEEQNGANDSTYWIYFELLWREYFYWYARCHDKKLFFFSGITGQAPLTTFYSQRFKSWQSGQTPFPIVNACMNQLNETGYMSNRGRQLVASCLIHELGIDWRYGAAYFESQLIDYDVGSNWGNWQYLGGVGADPRGSRRFDLQKQTEIYDPFGDFIEEWGGNNKITQVDAVDMVDWPLSK
ncbi:DASH family cryptochrome [Vibrio maerlii]|uniref:DASH family cryptochrome n=1 Tax=Vibrio maerlii TaxID=2231648 RepID=UPI000E3E29BE|nr:DASH family cryptochrome [Vibrio maerlii]